MFKRKLFAVSVLMLFILSVGFVSAAQEPAQSPEISDNTDELGMSDGDILESSLKPAGDTFNDIQKVINRAKENDVVTLNGTYHQSANPLSIKKSVTLEGVNDATLDGENMLDECIVEIMNEDFDDSNVKKPVVTFKNIKFVNAKQGAVSVACRVSYINCTFEAIKSDFSDDFFGGAIQGDYLTFKDCKFTDCASKWGGAINAYDSTVTNCIFTDNRAVYGGAIFGSGINVKNSIFTNNRATDGGALALESTPAQIVDCVFENNYAKGYGSSIYAYCYDTDKSKYHINVKNSTFSADRADYSSNFNQFDFNYKDYGNGSIFTYAHKYIKLNNNIDAKGLSNQSYPKTSVKLTPVKLSAVYGSSKVFKVKVTDSSGKAMANVYLNVALYIKNIKKAISYKTIKTDSKGIATLKVSKLQAQTYRAEITPSYLKYTAKKASSTIKISKAKAVAKAPKVTAKFKKSKYFKVTVKANKKALKNIRVKVKVFTGKKSKTYTIKTNKKGVAKLNTKKLKRGKHKVSITSANANYKISAKSTITIR